MKKWFTKTIGKLLFYKEKIEMFNQEIIKSKESHLVNTLSCGFFLDHHECLVSHLLQVSG